MAFMIHDMVHFLRNFFIPPPPAHARRQQNNAKDRFITKVRIYNRNQHKSPTFLLFSFTILNFVSFILRYVFYVIASLQT